MIKIFAVNDGRSSRLSSLLVTCGLCKINPRYKLDRQKFNLVVKYNFIIPARARKNNAELWKRGRREAIYTDGNAVYNMMKSVCKIIKSHKLCFACVKLIIIWPD